MSVYFSLGRTIAAWCARVICAGALWCILAVSAQALTVDLRFDGAEPQGLRDTVSEASGLLSLPDLSGAQADDVLALARADYARIVAALYDQSYYSGNVTIQADGREVATLDPFNPPRTVAQILIQITPGPAFTFGRIRIGPLAPGSTPPPGLARGKRAFADVVRSATQQAGEDWRASGHAMVEVADVDIVANHASATLDVTVALAPGPLVVFGTVVIRGDTAVRHDRVRKIMGIPTGQRFDPAVIAAGAARLRKTGVFKSVVVTEDDRLGPGNSLDVLVTLVDREPRRIGLGLEASTTDGGRFSAFWLHRNFLGRADRLTVDVDATQLFFGGLDPDYSLSFRITRPAAFGPNSTLYFGGKARLLSEPAFKSKDAFLSFGATRQQTDRLVMGAELGLQYSQITDRTVTPNTQQRFVVGSLDVTATLDQRDDPLDATTGYYLQARVKPFYEFEFDNAGVQLGIDGRVYTPVAQRNDLTFALRAQAQVTLGLPHGQTPTNYLFYSGGAGTVRGQGYQALGATAGTTSQGGQAFAGLSSELRWSVTDAFGVVSFVDVGFVGQDGFDQGQVHSGAGLGVRYKTPLGPIRFDIAAPLSGPGGDGVQLYLGIGQSF